ncbi:cell division protein FtsQ/DivIB [Roseivirga sp.]|uniref:cell division protein FtsQ/DivIB n=1 Tax=Roseivirga sp. TaxID=1964215 RepID=UPI003B8B7ABA
MKTKETILRVAGIIGGCVIIFLMISFVEKREVGYRIEDIDVEIENAFENFFIDEADVMSLIMENEGDSVLGDKFGRVSLKAIENRIESHSFVKDAEVFRDLKGHLVVKARQNKPVARLISNRGESAYIGEDGDLLPVSTKYTARVPVITGRYVAKMLDLTNVKDREEDADIFDLVNHINADKFWTKQVGQIIINSSDDIIMYPQVGNQMLELGNAKNIENKFKNLKIFFKEIMPTKGWNTYKRVNVAFKDQIICDTK